MRWIIFSILLILIFGCIGLEFVNPEIRNSFNGNSDIISGQILTNSNSKEDMHYSIGPINGEIKFGDGIHGELPQSGKNISANYRNGGGNYGRINEDDLSLLRLGNNTLKELKNLNPFLI